MKISVVIASLIDDAVKLEATQRCVKSLIGADEVIVLSPNDYSWGFCRAWNTAASLATGDFLVFVGATNFLTIGSIRDLAVEDTVTCPLINGRAQEFWGFVFCVPRNIYEKYGLYDMAYNDGIHLMDEDLWKRFKKEGVALKSIDSVNFDHPLGGLTINNTHNFHEKAQKNIDIFNERWGK